MLLNTAPQNEAIMSNVGEIGDFKIKASAKAFNILSSGLYANKVRAIIRELSCNAVDSHVAAGKADTPFDVHLPNRLEPWFAIRDYGTGLSHDQVTSIYTTYFESTKTDSNDYIGALGLGSKSPFSYTDNFTVTAIKDGRKGIYTAFINDAGVPSIALMSEEDTKDSAGIEIKFAVEDRWDFSKFEAEAKRVYQYFKLRPVVSGVSEFEIEDITYDTKDIISGVHSFQNNHGYGSVAVMGNIAYPIEIPESNKDIGGLRKLLNCGLEMHFAIGELDFQASREGLSYIPQTINAINAKLEALNAQLTNHLAKEADVIPNLWDRALFLHKKRDSSLWGEAVTKYVTDTKLATWDHNQNSWYKTRSWKFKVDDLAKDYNISLRCFTKNRGSTTCSMIKPESEYDRSVTVANGNYLHYHVQHVRVDSEVFFIVNDQTVGATERAKYHFRENKWAPDTAPQSATVYVIEPADKTKPVKSAEFFKLIQNPPVIMKSSELLAKPRKDSSLGKNVTIMKLQEKVQSKYTDVVGFNVKQFYTDLKDCGIESLRQNTIYGVRKGDIEFIQTQPNWINIEDHIVSLLKKIDNKLAMSLVLQAVDNFNLLSYNVNIVSLVAPESPYYKLVSQFEGFDRVRYSESSLKNLCRRYAQGTVWNPEVLVNKYVAECKVVYERYPLLQYLRSAPNHKVAEYINMIDDTQKGVK